jgi:hypothetical protein
LEKVEKKPGTSGSTHGEKKDSIPKIKATEIVSSINPF